MQAKRGGTSKKPARTPGYVSPNQLTLCGFETPFEQALNIDNRWVQLSRMLPWDKIVGQYDKVFKSLEGRPPISGLKGGAFTDKGFINQQAFEQLFKCGLQVITGTRRNMKNKLMNYQQKILLKKRGMIESVNDILKTVCDIEHTRYGSRVNALLNIFAGICAYTFLERLPSIF